MNRQLFRLLGVGAWFNGAWDFNAYFIHGEIIPFLHSWTAFVPMFAVFFGYPIAGLILIFGKMSFSADIARALDDMKTELHTLLDIELEI